MKKILSILLMGVLLIGLTGCGDKNKTNPAANLAEVLTNEGEIKKLSPSELISVYDSNEAKFNKLYSGAKITFKGTVKKIAVNIDAVTSASSVSSFQNKIVFEEGWCLVIGKNNTLYDLADYDAGDVLEVTTAITSAVWSDYIKNISDNERVIWLGGNDLDDSSNNAKDITTIITKIN